MPIAMTRIMAAENPGARRSSRNAYATSCPTLSIQGAMTSLRASSRASVTLPIARRLAPAASAAEIPDSRRRCSINWRWLSISSANSAWARRARHMAATRRNIPGSLPATSRRFQNLLNRADHTLELLALRCQPLSSFRRERVIPGAPVVLRGAPRRGDPAVHQQALQRRIERAFTHLQHVGRDLTY